ncbi:Aldo-Keto Reductase Family 1 Member B1 [Manis pentadactyla]|nr:Aldo-Keto Reductase Family 1 Member B1 [Manis pentadactyla]
MQTPPAIDLLMRTCLLRGTVRVVGILMLGKLQVELRLDKAGLGFYSLTLRLHFSLSPGFSFMTEELDLNLCIATGKELRTWREMMFLQNHILLYYEGDIMAKVDENRSQHTCSYLPSLHSSE